MEVLAGAILTAGAAVAAAIITSVVSTKRVDKDLAIHDEKSASRKQSLSSEHANLEKGLGGISQAVIFLKEGRVADEARREAMRGQELDTKKALEVFEAAVSQMADQRDEIAGLKKENAALRHENAMLRRELARNQETEQEEELEL